MVKPVKAMAPITTNLLGLTNSFWLSGEVSRLTLTLNFPNAKGGIVGHLTLCLGTFPLGFWTTGKLSGPLGGCSGPDPEVLGRGPFVSFSRPHNSSPWGPSHMAASNLE